MLGRKPEQRMIVILLAIIAGLLAAILWYLTEIEDSLGYQYSCGGWGSPCQVEIVR